MSIVKVVRRAVGKMKNQIENVRQTCNKKTDKYWWNNYG